LGFSKTLFIDIKPYIPTLEGEKYTENNKTTKEPTEPQKANLDYNSLIKKVTENGDLCVFGMKGTCKTTLLMHLARTIMEDSHNHLIIFETFPKWIFEFDSVPYMIIKDGDVQPKENLPYLENGSSIIQWSKDFNIINAEKVRVSKAK